MIFSVDYIDRVRNIANANLVSLYSMQELSGDMIDLSPSGDNITPSGPTQNGARMKDGSPAYLFDGVNDWGDIDNAGLNLTVQNTVTVMVWWQITDSGVWTDGTNRDLLWLFDSTADLVNIAKGAANDTFFVRVEIGNDNNQIDTTAYNDTNWHCCVVRWDSTGPTRTCEFFMDGVSVGTMPHTASWSGDEPLICSLGSFRNGSSNFWAGNIGPWALWTKELTDAEVEVISKL